jgi:hypothetical protein
MNATDSASTIFGGMFTMSDEAPLISELAADIPTSAAVDVYEVNLGTVSGSAPESMRDPYVAGAAAGAALADRLITGMYSGIIRQTVWNLAQYNYTGDAGTVALWGILRDLTTTSSFRPTGLAMRMLNCAIGNGDFYPVTASGPDASGINAAAFFDGDDWSMAITNAKSAATTISVTMPSPAGGTWVVGELSSASPTNTNETSTDVTIDRMTPVSSPATVTVPAYGLVVLSPVGEASMVSR